MTKFFLDDPQAAILALLCMLTFVVVITNSASPTTEPDMWAGQEEFQYHFPAGSHAKPESSSAGLTLLGFSEKEEWGAWSVNEDSAIGLPWGFRTPVLLRICGGVLRPIQLKGALVEINGFEHALALDSDGCFVQGLSKLDPEIWIRNISLLRPISIGLGADTRTLGFSLRWIEVTSN